MMCRATSHAVMMGKGIPRVTLNFSAVPGSTGCREPRRVCTPIRVVPGWCPAIQDGVLPFLSAAAASPRLPAPRPAAPSCSVTSLTSSSELSPKSIGVSSCNAASWYGHQHWTFT